MKMYIESTVTKSQSCSNYQSQLLLLLIVMFKKISIPQWKVFEYYAYPLWKSTLASYFCWKIWAFEIPTPLADPWGRYNAYVVVKNLIQVKIILT